MDYEQLGLNLPESTLSWGGHPASVRPLLESVLALLIRATDGPNISGSFAILGPDGSWRKTALGYCQLMMDGSLQTYSGAWPRRATMSAGIAGEPPTWKRRTSGTGYSSSENWPTPDTNNHWDGTHLRKEAHGMHAVSLHHAVALWPTPTTPNGGRSVAHVEDWRSDMTAYHNGKKVQVDLNAAVKMWPTPRANDAEKRGEIGNDPRNGLPGAVNWPTPRSSDANGIGKHGDGGPDLRTTVWNTPTCNDAKNSSLPPSMGKRDSLTGDLIRDGVQGILNPDWVETLQGYPAGWTRLPEGWKNKGGQQGAGRSNTNGNRPE